MRFCHNRRVTEPEGFSDLEHLALLRQREHIVVALSVGQSRWPEVLEIITDCEDGAEACARLAACLGLDDVQTTAVLDTQFRRVTTSERARIEAELTELRARIADLTRKVELRRKLP